MLEEAIKRPSIIGNLLQDPIEMSTFGGLAVRSAQGEREEVHQRHDNESTRPLVL